MANTELIKLCVDVIKDPAQVQHFSNGKNVDERIRTKFAEAIGVSHPTKKELRKHEVTIYEILEEVLTETYLNVVNEDEFFMRFAETRNLALGDTQEFYVEDDGVLFVSEHSGNHWNISRQKLEGGTSFPIKTKPFAAGVYGDFELFMTGRLTFSKLITKVGEAIQNKIYNEVAASFASATAQLPTEFKKSGAFEEKKLVELVALVEAASGSNPIVLGTRQGLANILEGANIALYTEAMKAELNNTGRISNYKGMTLVQLPAVFKPNTFEFAYDDKQLLVLPANDDRFIKLVFEGEDYIKQVQDNTSHQDMSLEYKFITKFGTAVIFSSLFGKYTLI